MTVIPAIPVTPLAEAATVAAPTWLPAEKRPVGETAPSEPDSVDQPKAGWVRSGLPNWSMAVAPSSRNTRGRRLFRGATLTSGDGLVDGDRHGAGDGEAAGVGDGDGEGVGASLYECDGGVFGIVVAVGGEGDGGGTGCGGPGVGEIGFAIVVAPQDQEAGGISRHCAGSRGGGGEDGGRMVDGGGFDGDGRGAGCGAGGGADGGGSGPGRGQIRGQCWDRWSRHRCRGPGDCGWVAMAVPNWSRAVAVKGSVAGGVHGDGSGGNLQAGDGLIDRHVDGAGDGEVAGVFDRHGEGVVAGLGKCGGGIFGSVGSVGAERHRSGTGGGGPGVGEIGFTAVIGTQDAERGGGSRHGESGLAAAGVATVGGSLMVTRLMVTVVVLVMEPAVARTTALVPPDEGAE